MKTIPATILVFDSKSLLEDVRKYIGEYVFFFNGDQIDFDNYATLESVLVRKDYVFFESDCSDEYDCFAIIEM